MGNPVFKYFCALAGALSLVALPSAALAQTTVNSSRASFASDSGDVGFRSANANNLTGDYRGSNYRGYISFAVPASASAFTSAVIRVDVGYILAGPNDLTVYDVSSDIATAAGSDLYADFGSGTIFGEITGLNTSNATVDITLNAAGLAAVNAARGGEISFGFTNDTIDQPNDGVFNNTYGYTQRQLILTPTATAPAPIPTMSEWAMILFGLSLAGGVALYIQRRQTTV